MEEDIKILEESIDKMIKDERIHDDYRNTITALENLIKGYRELEGENKKYESGSFLTPAQCVRIGKDYIPKSLLKHKRQELEYDQLENPRNICEDRIKIEFIDELLEG